MKSHQLNYDGTFEGFLTLVFEVYNQKLIDVLISVNDDQELFSINQAIITDLEKSDRVWKGLMEKGGKKISNFTYRCFLSESKGIENKLLYLIRNILVGRAFKVSDFSDEIVLDLHRILKKVNREVHRMHAFVRFQETKDGIWACEINPDFNVLPLIGSHFLARYPVQEWLIFDTKRGYGIHHEIGKDIDFVSFPDYKKDQKLIEEIALSDGEKTYQEMWKKYFKSVNIQERNNHRLHLRHVPRRYWRYLIEKEAQ